MLSTDVLYLYVITLGDGKREMFCIGMVLDTQCNVEFSFKGFYERPAEIFRKGCYRLCTLLSYAD